MFRVKEMEEIGMNLASVEAAVDDLSKFNSFVKLAAFSPFKSGTNALENMNSISEGVLHEDLRVFLETNVPNTGSKKSAPLGVTDAKLAAAIGEELGIACQHTGVVPEIIRGIRLHFGTLVKGLTEQTSSKAQLGLGHSYSRSKVKFNVHRVDNMIIQAISLLDQLDKDINTFAMRIREWYSYHFPELIKIVSDNYLYAKVARFIKNRKELSEDQLEELEEMVMDSSKAQAILDASRSSMGMDISPLDLINIERFATRVISLAEYRKELHNYLISRMNSVAPNLSHLIGETVGARLISRAGSLTNLAKYPASTVQILGAEKALFRALKTRGNTPKYGLIFHSTFIGRAGAKNKGRISRYLANKCSVASRIDCFSEMQTHIYGDMLKQQVEDRLKFYESGAVPRKNLDVMKEATEMALKEQKKKKKEKKKEKKRKASELEDSADVEKSKHKKHKVEDVTMDDSQVNDTREENINNNTDSAVLSQSLTGEETKSSKKKKKKHDKTLDGSEAAQNVSLNQSEMDDESKPKKKKKKHDESLDVSQVAENVSLNQSKIVDEVKAKKKKKKHSESLDVSQSPVATLDISQNDDTSSSKKKKKELERLNVSETAAVDDANDSMRKHKKKKKSKSVS